MSSHREQLFEDAKYGRITPEQAEEKAALLGLKPFAREPDAADFDPQKEPWWSLPMTVAWIAWRSIDKVRDNWNAFREECWDWHWRPWRVGFDGPEYEGHFLETRPPITMPLLQIAETLACAKRELPQSALSTTDAVSKLWRALEDGLIEATGIEIKTVRRIPIPKVEWRDLRNVEVGRKDVLAHLRTSTNRPVYEEIEFPRNSIMNLWPPKRGGIADLPLPPQIPPTGAGYMPLYCAAQWIATRGGSMDIDPRGQEFWEGPFRELTERIASDEIKVLGVVAGKNEPIPGHVFASLRVDYPFTDIPLDLLFQEELYLCSHPYIDEKTWRDGFDDSLRNRLGVVWKTIVVHKPDVLKYWPFSLEPRRQTSGAPGRPTSMHLVEAEYRARWERDQVNVSISKESEGLSEWLAVSHPTEPRLKPKSIENHLRAEHRRRLQGRDTPKT